MFSGILDVAEEDQVAQAIHLGVGAENVDGFADIAGGKSCAAVGEHFFEDGRHLREVARVLGVDASGRGLGAVGKAKQKIADALEADHELHAGEKFASLGGPTSVMAVVTPLSISMSSVSSSRSRWRSEFSSAFGAGGDAFGSGAGGFFGHVTGFDGAAHEVVVGRFGVGLLIAVLIGVSAGRERGRRANSPASVAATLPFMRSDGQRLSIESSDRTAG